MSRAIPALREPVGDLTLFPRWQLTPGRTVYRAHRPDRSPWWFTCAMSGRFDLSAPSGTCYLAASQVAALRERCGKKLIDQGVLTAGEASRIAVSTLAVPVPRELADMRSARATAFGLTREINTIVPYGLPQRWATALSDAGLAGIRYEPRFSTTPSAIGYAIFDNAGQRSWSTDPAPAPSAAVAQAAGITIAQIPRAGSIPVIPTPPQPHRNKRPHRNKH